MATPIPRNQAGFTLAEIAQVTAGELIGADAACVGVTTDSRAVVAGNLYVALRGEHHDGHRFVAQALASGATAALVADRSALPPGGQGIVVDDTLRALGALASLHRRRWGGRLVAITGSAGKTTTKELTFAALRAAGARVVRSSGNLNNLVGAPLSLLCLDAAADVAVIEIGTSAPGEIARLSEICAPDVGVVTAVAIAHAAGLGSLADVAAEKASLLWSLPASGIAIYRAGDAALAAQLGGIRAERRIGFGSTDDADVQLLSRTISSTAPALRGGAPTHAAPSMHCELRIAQSGTTLGCDLEMFGTGPALDAAAAIAVVLALLGESALAGAARGLADVAPVPGRLSPRALASGALLLDDSYNANPASMQTSIETALDLSRVRGGRTLFVLGDMLELGASSRAEHEAVGRLAAQAGVAAFVACGVEMTAAAETAREQARRLGYELSVAHLSDPAGAAELVQPLLRARDVVLVKGSRSMAMERVAAGLGREGAA